MHISLDHFCGIVSNNNKNLIKLQERANGQRLNIILVAEGAQDKDGNPISAEQVKKVF